ncbi:protein TolQ [Nitrincola iocasae]|uniref:Tol-Pal system protein TolQ n=1 Tax=Nitrincola iocasae TaxID=2614693 RepID=A0A5J6LF59_9GAMM|nr:protein TolQ [Nitrincola iocasae]QEW07187.1 protein TolQ [Nitrincola iocasae]
MQDKLSIWSLVVEASFIVQLIMLTLMITSFVSWVMIFQRRSVIRAAQRSMRTFEERFWSGADLGQLYREVSQQPNENCGVENIFRAGLKEFTRLTQQGKADPDVVMNGIQRRMRVAMSREEEKLAKHLPFLATVGSTSPYMGLFGTVWGIMNTFRSLATVPHATISVVAPGISEALITTAIGLFAAIPAVIAYNRYAAQSETLLSNYETFADEFSSILYRRLHAL